VRREQAPSLWSNLPSLIGTLLAVGGLFLVIAHGLTNWWSVDLDRLLGRSVPTTVQVLPVRPAPAASVALDLPDVVVSEEPTDEAEPVAPEPVKVLPVAPEPVKMLAVAPSQQMIIPRIGVNSSIVNVALANGEWPVPRFVVGHLAESVNAGETGNAVFAGHLLSLTNGNVFSRLKELEVGDDMVFQSEDGERWFRVMEAKVVRNTDVSVLAARPGLSTVTLITCEGTWIQKELDYDHRRVVVAEAIAPPLA
jgi:LPXTG-site transpeptidase (sortase) family protein